MNENEKVKLAPLFDRFLAFCIDLSLILIISTCIFVISIILVYYPSNSSHTLSSPLSFLSFLFSLSDFEIELGPEPKLPLSKFIQFFSVSYFLYSVYFHSIFRATPGKILLNLKVISDGEFERMKMEEIEIEEGAKAEVEVKKRVGFIIFALRWFLSIFSILLFGVGIFLAIFSDKRKTFHDIISGTVVVSDVWV